MSENKLVYICSSYAGDVGRNVEFAKAACRFAMEQNCTPVAVHLLYPQLLDDADPAQRQAGIRMGLRVLESADELWLCGSRISEGMRAELAAGKQLGIPVKQVSESEIQGGIDMKQYGVWAVRSANSVCGAAQMHRNREPLLHAAVYIELSAHDIDQLKLLQTEVLTELIRSKLNVDRLMLRQQQGFVCVMPSGWNVFGDQFERVLPASSVANLYPFNYSGKTDANGFYVGRDKFGSNVLVDFNKRADDKTNANILILGNSGQGKSYLLKLILCDLRESGMNVLCLDPEMEYEDLTNNLGGCFIDLMSGDIINVLEPKSWDENGSPENSDAPQAFRQTSKLSQHISFLKDFFRTYKDFTDRQIDVIGAMTIIILLKAF